MWDVLKKGIRFEVGAVLNTESEVSQAVMILRKKHPEVELVFQSYVWVLQLSRSAKVSPDGWKHLEKGEYIPNPQLTGDRFFDAHAAFMNRNDTTIESAEARAFDEDRTKHGIKLTTGPAPEPPAGGDQPEIKTS